jgi:hypothetical protein
MLLSRRSTLVSDLRLDHFDYARTDPIEFASIAVTGSPEHGLERGAVSVAPNEPKSSLETLPATLLNSAPGRWGDEAC